MAAAEYYLGTAAAKQLHGQPQHAPASPYPPQQQRPAQHSYPSYYSHVQDAPSFHSATPPPSYSAYEHPAQSTSQLQTQAYPPNGRPSYPQTPAVYATSAQNGNLLGPLVQPIRSHSQPARVHFADSASDSDTSSSDKNTRRRHRHKDDRHYRRSESRPQSHRKNSSGSSSDYSSSDDDHSRDRSRHSSQRHHKSRSSHKERKDRQTFLGAGAGGIIGDAIFPGLGTAAGLLLGGYGGRKHAEGKGRRRRARSDVGERR